VNNFASLLSRSRCDKIRTVTDRFLDQDFGLATRKQAYRQPGVKRHSGWFIRDWAA
jgi:hypothetical protein